MKTNLQVELAELEARHIKEQSNLRRSHAIKAALPDELEGMEVHITLHPLYGTTAAVGVKHDYFAYGQDRKQPTLETVVLLAEKFPPLPIRMIRDSSLSFRTAAHVDALEESKKERWSEETNVSPFTVDVDAFQHRTMKVEWNAAIPGTDEIVGFDVVLPLDDRLGILCLSYESYMGGRRVRECSFIPNAKRLHTLFHAGEPVAQLCSPIKWASGGPEYPSRHTLYWVDLRDDMTASPLDFVAALTAADTAAS